MNINKLSKEELKRELQNLQKRISELENNSGTQEKNNKPLEENKNHSRLIYGQSSVPCQSLDSRGVIREVNDAWCQTLGYDRDEVIGHWFGDFLTDKYVPLFKERFPLFMEQKVVIGVDFEMKCRGGGTKYVSYDGRALVDEKGEFVYSQCVFQDVTDHKRYAHELEASEERLRQIINGSLNVIVLSDKEGNIFYVSDSVRDVLGYTPEEYIGNHKISGLSHPDDIPEMKRNLDKVMSRPRAVGKMELRIKHKDGTWRWLEAKATNMLDEKKIGAILIAYYDITDRKLAENKLKSRIEQEKIITRLSSLFINTGSDQLDRNINLALREIGRFTGADRSYVFLFHDDTDIADNTHEWCDEGIEPQIDQLQAINIRELVPWLKEKLGQGEAIAVSDINRLGPDAGAEKRLFKQLEIKALLNVPMFHNGNFRGFIGFDKVRSTNDWSDEIIVLIKIVGEIIINSIERKRSLEALRESEERYRRLTDNTQEIVFRLGVDDLQFEYVSSACLQVSGYSPKEIMETDNILYKLIHPDSVPQMENDLKQVLDGSGGRYSELKIIHKDGSVRYILQRSILITDDDGRPVAFEGIATDITSLKNAERAVRESEQKYRAIFESARDAIFIKGKDLKYTDVNPVFEDLFDLSVDEIVGKSDSELFEKEVGDQIEASDQIVLKGEILEVEGERPIHGETRIFHIIKVPMRGANDEVVGICGIARDITEKKRIEDELSKSDKLESVGVLAGGIAHDFNNILTGVFGNISLAKMELPMKSEAFGILSDAEKAAARARNLTEQLLTFSQGGAPLLKTTSIVDVIKDSVDFALRGSNVKAVYDIPESLNYVEIDEGQISRVIHNLVINANQAMPDGGILEIRGENIYLTKSNDLLLKSGQYVKISVIDQGVGISENNLKRIFDPFFTTKAKGTGLGLSSAYSIIKKHNGNIKVQSKVDYGTKFLIYLPASEKVLDEAKESELEVLGGSGSIMVVDDEEPVRSLASFTLNRYGYDVTECANYEEAYVVFKSTIDRGGRFDAVVMDLTIPGGIGGKEALPMLKEIDPDIVTIVSSGYSNDPVIANYRENGFSGCVAKPYRPREIVEAVDKAIKNYGRVNKGSNLG